MNPSSIEIEIGELILDGLAMPIDGRLQAALVAQLGQLLAAQLPAGLANDGAVARLHGGAISVAPGGTGASLGESIAGAVYRSLRGMP